MQAMIDPTITHQARRRGRPKAAAPCVNIQAWVPVSTADAICRLAIKHRVSVSAVAATAMRAGLSSLRNSNKPS